MSAVLGPSRWPRVPELRDRFYERRVLDQVVASVRAGESRALVIHGEPGVGKTALLDYVGDHAAGCRVVRVAGIEPEMEFPFAGIHQLCSPFLDRITHIPEPQSAALQTAFGLRAGPPPDPFLVALGILSLLSEVASDRPLLCLIDDHQWLDFASATILPATARRLGAESVGLVFAIRNQSEVLAGLTELTILGLGDADSHALLASVVPGKIDARVRDQIVAETRGNPLALLELPGA